MLAGYEEGTQIVSYSARRTHDNIGYFHLRVTSHLKLYKVVSIPDYIHTYIHTFRRHSFLISVEPPTIRINMSHDFS
jgi:hypothetical protein